MQTERRRETAAALRDFAALIEPDQVGRPRGMTHVRTTLNYSLRSVSPADQELLLARRFAGEEAARIYAVPPPIIGDLTHGSFANVNDLLRYWAMGTIAQWCRRVEAEFVRSVFTDTERRTYELSLDLSGLLRGDPAQRWAAWKIAVDSRVLTPNEVRGEEGWNPRPGGDEFPPTPTPTPP